MRRADDKDGRRARPGLWSATLRAKACVAATDAVDKEAAMKSVSTRTLPTKELNQELKDTGVAMKALERGYSPK